LILAKRPRSDATDQLQLPFVLFNRHFPLVFRQHVSEGMLAHFKYVWKALEVGQWLVRRGIVFVTFYNIFWQSCILFCVKKEHLCDILRHEIICMLARPEWTLCGRFGAR